MDRVFLAVGTRRGREVLGAAACREHAAEARCAQCQGACCETCSVETKDGVVCRGCLLAAHQALVQARKAMTASGMTAQAWIVGGVTAVLGALAWERIATVVGVNSVVVGMATAWAMGLLLIAANGARRGAPVQRAALLLTLGSCVCGLVLQAHSILEYHVVTGNIPPLSAHEIWVNCLIGLPEVVRLAGPVTWATLILAPLFAWRVAALPAPLPDVLPTVQLVTPQQEPELQELTATA